MQLDNPILVGH